MHARCAHYYQYSWMSSIGRGSLHHADKRIVPILSTKTLDVVIHMNCKSLATLT